MTNTLLIGRKTILRPISLTDVPLFTEWNNSPKIREYLGRRFPLTELDEKTWIEKISILTRSPSDIVLIVEEKDSKKVAGIMGLHNINWVDRNATTGTIIGSDYQGKGIATDAKMALLEYAFENLGMHKIISHADARNKKSIEYSKRCGYEVEAVHKEEIFHAGKWEDKVTLACFYENWKKAQTERQLKK